MVLKIVNQRWFNLYVSGTNTCIPTCWQGHVCSSFYFITEVLYKFSMHLIDSTFWNKMNKMHIYGIIFLSIFFPVFHQFWLFYSAINQFWLFYTVTGLIVCDMPQMVVVTTKNQWKHSKHIFDQKIKIGINEHVCQAILKILSSIQLSSKFGLSKKIWFFFQNSIRKKNNLELKASSSQLS